MDLAEDGCPWLNISKEKLIKVIILQNYFKKYIFIKHLTNIIDEISNIYYIPNNRGFYYCQQEFNQ
jgi:hypothetical protein